MASPVFTLEALQADHGDSLLLHYGDLDHPKLIVIDGGPAGIFQNSLEPRLKTILDKRGGGALSIRMLMVSHIDDDHINGVLKFMEAMRKLRDENRPLPYDVLTLWHNSFDDIIANGGAGLAAALQAPRFGAHQADGAAIAASVNQGRQLRLHADRLAINMNSGFDDLIRFDPQATPLKISPGLTFRVLGPRKTELDSLETDWDTFLTKKQQGGGGSAGLDAIAAEFLDTSVANLSSIVVVAEAGGKRMLLTGDARGDRILESVREARLAETGSFAVDIFKMPHHGSDRNGGVELFRTIPAKHYVVSADGKHGNPDNATFDELFEARPTGPYDIWLTNRVASAVNHINAKKPAGVTLHVRATEPSIKVELEAPITW